eukprot:Colp12_sorted_trinity150504_noHs@9167
MEGIPSPFKTVVARLQIHMAPRYLGNVMEGVFEQLNQILMKYSNEVEGIVVSYSNVEVLEKAGKVMNDTPHIHFMVKVRLLVFSPKVGSKLVGKVSILGSDHIGLLVHGLFNASVSREAISADFEFDEQAGNWYNSENSEVRIQEDTYVVFTVTGIERVDHMLSISGSLLSEGTGVFGHIPADEEATGSPAMASPPPVSSKRKHEEHPTEEKPKKQKKDKSKKEAAAETPVPASKSTKKEKAEKTEKKSTKKKSKSTEA